MNGEMDMLGLEWGLYFAGIAIVLFAQFKIQGTYKKYKKVF
jgi:Zn-dependent membrane protease YugP